MRILWVWLLAILILPIMGCHSLFDYNSGYNARIREFTARDALEVLGLPRMANAAALEAKFTAIRSNLLPQIAETLRLVRAGEAVSKGATAKNITVFVIDDFSFWKLADGRYHGDYVSALIKLIAPEVTILTCDAWKEDLGKCLFDANDLARQRKIQIVNMSLGITGTYCEFIGQNFSDAQIIRVDYVFSSDQEPFEPHLFFTPQQAGALEHWVQELRSRGVTVISSAGNDGYKRGAKAPGCWSSLAVGAVYDAPFEEIKWSACTDQNVQADDRTCWSNYGHVFAPGAKVDGVFQGGISFNGTSASAPITTGVAALVAGTKGLRGDAVAEQIVQTAVSIRDRFNTGLKHSRLDAVLATGVGSAPPPQTLRGFLDKNKNCVLDDAEILTALHLWITQAKWNGKETISDSEMLSLLHDWIKQNTICSQ